MPFTGSTTGSLRGGGSSILSDVIGGTVVGAALGVDDPDPCCIATGLSRYRSHEGIRSQLRIITNYWNFTEGCALSELIRIKSAHEKRTALRKATEAAAGAYFLTAVAAVASLDPCGTHAHSLNHNMHTHKGEKLLTRERNAYKHTVTVVVGAAQFATHEQLALTGHSLNDSVVAAPHTFSVCLFVCECGVGAVPDVFATLV